MIVVCVYICVYIKCTVLSVPLWILFRVYTACPVVCVGCNCLLIYNRTKAALDVCIQR